MNCESHNFKIKKLLVRSAKEKRLKKNEIDDFLSFCFKFDMKRNENFLFLHKSYPQKQRFADVFSKRCS